MNKKYLNIALLVLLIVIWGGVLYKHFGKSNVVVNPQENNINTVAYTPKATFSKDTFTLQLINNNPFKTAISVNKKYSKTIVTHKAKPKVKPKTNTKLEWPKIKYHGFVKSNNQNTPLILLNVDNVLYRKRVTESVKGITLVKVYNDSLKVSYQNNIKNIKKIHD